MSTCDKCRRDPVVFVKYSGAHLCKDHFSEFVEKRVKHELRKQVRLRGGERIAVAASGGKDSTVALELIAKILGPRRDLKLGAITVDEGIAGYRAPGIEVVSDHCRALGLEHIVVRFADEFGVTMDEIAKLERSLSTCSYCGVLRRAAMNKAALRWGATHIATGLNLDDTAQSILMNFSKGDVERLARLGPHKKAQRGLVPRIQPLRTIPESETTLYAMVKGHLRNDLECPYAPEALRNDYRMVLAQLEDLHPGTRHSILRSYDGILPALETMFPPAELGRCSCGEPTISGTCKACELIASLKSRT